MVVVALAACCAPSSVDAACTLDAGWRDLTSALLAGPGRGPSRRDVVRDADYVELAHAAAAGRHGSTHYTRVNPSADRPRIDIESPRGHRHEFGRGRRLPTTRETLVCWQPAKVGQKESREIRGCFEVWRAP